MSYNTMRDKLHLAGEGAVFTKTSSGVTTLLPAVSYDRLIAIYAQITEAFADGTGTMTGVKVGQGNDDDKFITDAANWIGGPTLGLDWVGAPTTSSGGFLNTGVGILSANQALTVTATAATGNGTGGMALAAVAIAAIAAA